MSMKLFLFAIVVVTVTSASAQSSSPVAGTWKLVAFETEIQATGERRQVYGKSPNGYLILTQDGRLMTIVTAENRKAGDAEAERAALHRTMIGYSGTYRIDGDKLVTKVDVSWNESWTGTEQTRDIKLDGNRLDILTAWAPAPNIAGNPTVRGVLVWERSK